jgi:hypothetical protein
LALAERLWARQAPATIRPIAEVIKEGDEGERYDGANRVFDAAKAELLETPPTTLAAATAAIAWLVEYDEPNVPKTSGEYMGTLIHSPIFAREEARA